MTNKEDVIFDRIMKQARNEKQNKSVSTVVTCFIKESFGILPLKYNLMALMAIVIGFVSSFQYLSMNNNYTLDTVEYSLEYITVNPINIAYLENN